ncbi:MAG: DMT family transporter [Hydrogenovibrio sp.]|uniref:DMT family transporter n=1 Tax=Hydrogenovibrio sp. TaxID=2065821 RepID=UPI00286FEFA6|nr:DMT family transporter [Hydrogenovibrio sp.]MDR9497685.1 DMT family transporter [Hydrogenovibrio sp.]
MNWISSLTLIRFSPLFVVLAAFFWGLAGGIGGMLMAIGWDPLLVSFYRGTIGLLFVAVWLAISSRGSGLSDHRLWFWSVIAGLGVAGNFSFYFLSIAEGSVAVAATLMYCAPVFVYLVSFALGLERPTLIKWLAIALVVVGILLLTGLYKIGASDVTLIGVGAGLLAGLSYAIFIFGFKYAAPHGSPQAVLVIAFTTFVAILVWLIQVDQAVAVLSSSRWPLFVTIGVLGAGVSFILYVVGLNQTAPAVASIVAMVEPVTASLFGVWVLDERLAALQLAGMGLILVTVTALSVYASARSPVRQGATD